MASAAYLRGFRRDTRKLLALPICAAFGIGMLSILNGKAVPRRPAAAPKPVASDVQLYTGAVILVPRDGDQCWKMMLDNRTGRMWDGGYIDCDAVAETINNDKRWSMSAERMQAVQAGFLKK